MKTKDKKAIAERKAARKKDKKTMRSVEEAEQILRGCLREEESRKLSLDRAQYRWQEAQKHTAEARKLVNEAKAALRLKQKGHDVSMTEDGKTQVVVGVRR